MAMNATSTSMSRTARARSARKIDAPFSTPTSTTPSGWSAVISSARRATVVTMAASSSSVSGCETVIAGPSLGEGVAHGLAQQRGAQLPTHRRQLAELLLQAGSRFGVALAHVRQQHLAEEHRFALGERAVHAQVTSLDAAGEEAGGDAHDLERVVVVLGFAVDLARRGDETEALELRDLRGVGAARRGELGARVAAVAVGCAEELVVTVVGGQRGRERGRPASGRGTRGGARRRRGGRRCGYGRGGLDPVGRRGGIVDRPGTVGGDRVDRLEESVLAARWQLVEALLDDLERKEVLLLLVEDPAEPGEVGGKELPIARRRAFRVHETL